MIKPTTILLLIATFALISLTSKLGIPATDFQTGVGSFIKKYSADFATINETFLNE
jgi:hypothetical protein